MGYCAALQYESAAIGIAIGLGTKMCILFIVGPLPEVTIDNFLIKGSIKRINIAWLSAYPSGVFLFFALS